jgi:hypothetical protein
VSSGDDIGLLCIVFISKFSTEITKVEHVDLGQSIDINLCDK